MTRFQSISGQESRYHAHHPVKLAKNSAFAASESTICAFPGDSVELAASLSTKSIFAQGVTPETMNMKLVFLLIG
ncbi:hypothetical protein BBD42_06155 [Paenibacillus sp. BIHB 4019]|uniref:Uncharacterized protein n=1 Tax=Paenibacillus sp. BIHB 4019 TaxID=1870819 RepID=A0A1B2DEF6_9BACL|nr:hypothetical protein BBD42_06155 [Paenibacillus sp. BIHB 4019]